MAVLAVALGVQTLNDHPRPAGARRRLCRGGVIVPAPPAVLRWLLLAALGFAVIGMHSLATVHPAGTPLARSELVGTPAAATEPAVVAEPAKDGTEPDCCSDDPAMDHSGSSGHSHHLLHLCLAVLVALAGLVLGWLLWRRGPATTGHRESNPAVTYAGRGPPRARLTGDLLSSLCVLRL